MDRTDGPTPAPTPAPGQQIGTDAEQTIHRPPAPTPAEHNATFVAQRGHSVPTGFDSAGQLDNGTH